MHLKNIFSSKFKRNIKEQLGVPSHHASLLYLKKRGFDPKFVIDVGAYEGEWTELFIEVFPGAKVLMVEAQHSKESKLAKLKNRYSKIDYQIALLSSESKKEVCFSESETSSHIVNPQETIGGEIRQTISLADVLKQRNLPIPEMIKIDVQGHEIPVLKGADGILSEVEVILSEVTLMDMGFNEPLLLEYLRFLDNYGFQAYDICQFMRRPYDQAIYQADFIFVNRKSKLLSSKNWV